MNRELNNKRRKNKFSSNKLSKKILALVVSSAIMLSTCTIAFASQNGNATTGTDATTSTQTETIKTNLQNTPVEDIVTGSANSASHSLNNRSTPITTVVSDFTISKHYDAKDITPTGDELLAMIYSDLQNKHSDSDAYKYLSQDNNLSETDFLIHSESNMIYLADVGTLTFTYKACIGGTTTALVEGTVNLIVNPRPIVVETATNSWVYDGTPKFDYGISVLDATEDSRSLGLVSGQSFTSSMSTTVTDVQYDANNIVIGVKNDYSDFRVLRTLANGNQVDATSNYVLVDSIYGTLTITPVPDVTPTPTPTPEATPTPTPEATPTPTPEATPTPTPEATPTPTPEATPTPAPEVTPTPAPEVTPTPAPEVTPTPAPVVTPTPAPVVTPTPVPAAIVTPTPAPAATATPAPTAEPTPTPEATAEPTPAPITIEDDNTPTSDTVTIEDDIVPTAEGAAWALLNLILTIITIFLSVMYAFKKSKENEDNKDATKTDEEKNNARRLLAGKIFAVAVAVIGIITFVLTEDMTLPMTIVDNVTIFHAVYLVVQAIVMVVGGKNTAEKNNETNA